MKKLITIALAALVMASCTKTHDYKLAVVFSNADFDGTTAYLTSYDTGDTLAQAEIANANAVLQGKVEGSFMARLLVGEKRAGIIIEPGEITMKWDDGQAVSPLNDKLNAFEKKLEAIEDDAEAIPEFQKLYLDNADNGIGPWAFNYYLMLNDFTVAQIDSMLAAMPENYKAMKRVIKAKSDAQAKEDTAPGKQFTDFANDKGEKLSDHAGNGKYCLVDFWASWCGPCRREIAHIKENIYPKYKDKMNFVGIAVWDDDEATAKAVGELGIEWPVVMNGKNWTKPTDIYGVSGIPQILLIDPQGKIVARNLAGDQLDKAIEDAMAK